MRRPPSPLAPGVAIALLTLGAAGCGGDDANTAPSQISTGGQTASSADTDADIVSLVQRRGGRLNVSAGQLFGDRAQLEDFESVRAVAPARAAIASRMREEAAAAAGALARLAGGARTTSSVVSPAGQAFVGFESCARLGGDFFGDPDPDRSGRALREADRTCDGARAAYARAREELRRSRNGATTTQAAPGSATPIVIGNHTAADDPRSAELVRTVSPGTKITIVYRAHDVGSVPADLREDCAGPLTFTVKLAATGTPPVIDLASAGYSDTGDRADVAARITATDRFELDVGTFDVPAAAAGVTRLVVVPSAARCPDRATGAAHTPTFGTGITDTLVLRVRR